MYLRRKENQSSYKKWFRGNMEEKVQQLYGKANCLIGNINRYSPKHLVPGFVSAPFPIYQLSLWPSLITSKH
jgi:hypothetical protein